MLFKSSPPFIKRSLCDDHSLFTLDPFHAVIKNSSCRDRIFASQVKSGGCSSTWWIFDVVDIFVYYFGITLTASFIFYIFPHICIIFSEKKISAISVQSSFSFQNSSNFWQMHSVNGFQGSCIHVSLDIYHQQNCDSIAEFADVFLLSFKTSTNILKLFLGGRTFSPWWPHLNKRVEFKTHLCLGTWAFSTNKYIC